MGIFIPILQLKTRSPRLYHQEMAELGYEHGISLPALLPLPQAGLSSGHNGLLTQRRDCDLPLLTILSGSPLP